MKCLDAFRVSTPLKGCKLKDDVNFQVVKGVGGGGGGGGGGGVRPPDSLTLPSRLPPLFSWLPLFSSFSTAIIKYY